MSVKLSIKLIPIYAQNDIINALPIISDIKYFSFFMFDTPASKFIKQEGANGKVIIYTKLVIFIFLNVVILSTTFSLVSFFRNLYITLVDI